MLRIQLILLTLCGSAALFAQQNLDSRVAVYKTTNERFVVDSARLTDSVVTLMIGEIVFNIDEQEFARLERIPSATFSEPDQIYSFSLASGEIIVGQVVKCKRNLIFIRTGGGDTILVERDDLKGLNLEKRNVFAKPHVKKCATTNFISSPYALQAKETVYSSFIYFNSVEVGFGGGFSGKLSSSVLPFVLPTGLELSYRKRLEDSKFSIGMSVGQIYLGALGQFVSGEVVNSKNNFVTILSPNFTYHMGDAFLKTGVTMLSGSLDFENGGGIIITSTYSMPGFRRGYNRWNFTANIVPTSTSESSNGLNLTTFFLAGYQFHAPKASYTLGIGLAGSEAFEILPIPYAYFSLFRSKEQKKVANAFNMQRRMRYLQRSITIENARNKRMRKRAADRELKRHQRKN